MKKFFILTMLAVVLSGCAKKEEEASVKIALDWIPNTNHTGLYVALEKGYYAENGLNVSILEPPEDGAVPLMASGNADFAISYQEEIAAALSSDTPLPVVSVAAIIEHNTSGIISLKENNILGPKDIENHSCATWNTPVEQAILKDVITKDGGDFNNVNLIPLNVTDVITALQTDIDAVWIYYAWDGVATELAGLDTNYFYFKDIDKDLDFYTPVIAANENYLKNNSETAKKFLEATKKGYIYATENPEEAAIIIVKHAPEIDLDLAIKSQEYLASQYATDKNKWGEIDINRWDAFFDWLYNNGVIEKKLNSGQGFTNEYLPK